ncbi:MAG TPA: hypothetical protein VHD33_06645 [Legionellaceae bacterium]|nr:hypothetical protein [Legionellaceae bacterium]HWC57895.1 hypothetical protein [Candidatus Paceibacterota bacterium]
MTEQDIIELLQERDALFAGHSELVRALADLLVSKGVDYFKSIPYLTKDDITELEKRHATLVRAQESFRTLVLELIARSEQH